MSDRHLLKMHPNLDVDRTTSLLCNNCPQVELKMTLSFATLTVFEIKKMLKDNLMDNYSCQESLHDVTASLQTIIRIIASLGLIQAIILLAMI